MGHRCAAGKWNRVISFGSRSAQWKMVRGRNLRLNVATENWELIFIKKAVLSSRFSVLSNGFAESPMYIEFHARSAFSFLEGASLPESLIEICAHLDMTAMALLDRDGVYGAPRFYMAAKRAGIKAHIGAEVTYEISKNFHKFHNSKIETCCLPVLISSRAGYQNLCRLITKMKLRAKKGEGAVREDELREHAAGLICLTGGENGPLAIALAHGGIAEARRSVEELIDIFGRENVYIELQRHFH